MPEKTFSRTFKGRSNKNPSWADIKNIIDGIWGRTAFIHPDSKSGFSHRSGITIYWVDSDGANIRSERLEELRHDFELGKLRSFSIGHILPIDFVQGIERCVLEWSCERIASIRVEATSPEIVEHAVNLVRVVFREELTPEELTKDWPTRDYVDVQRLLELRRIQTSKFDLSRLVRLCEELNSAFRSGCYLTVPMIVRTILDHVPPILSSPTFAAVASGYAGGRSFREAMVHLDRGMRHIADMYLHQQIRAKESMPTPTQVDYSSQLDLLLQEICRVLK
jgi:hypothetical protein